MRPRWKPTPRCGASCAGTAAGSLAEGLDETLTLHRLGVYGVLGRFRIHHPPSAGGYPGSAHPGPRNPARETISCRPAATSPRSSLVSPALLPRPPKSPHIQRENGGEPPARSRSASTHATGWRRGQSRANPSRHDLGKCPQIVESTPVPPGTMTSRVVGMAP